MKTKRIFAGIITAALVFSLETMSVLAVEPEMADQAEDVVVCGWCGAGCAFVDEDGDGICDYYGTCAAYGQSAGLGFVDEDGDGICDNYENGACPGYGARRGCGRGRGRGCWRW